MINVVDIGWTVVFNDHSGAKCPAFVTKVYTPGDPESNLDLHVIGIKNNASFARGKINVSYGTIVGTWEYSDKRQVYIEEADIPTEGETLLYNSTTNTFESKPIPTLDCIDGGTF